MKVSRRTVVYATVLLLNLLLLLARLLSQTAPLPFVPPAAPVGSGEAFPGRRNQTVIGETVASEKKNKIIHVNDVKVANEENRVKDVKRIKENAKEETGKKHASEFETFPNCHNQSRCITPHLEVAHTVKVYFCKHSSSGGVRFYYLMRDGLLTHPRVSLVDFSHVDEADYIIYLPNSGAWHKTECSNTSFANKLIVLDEFDGHSNFAPFKNREERLKHYPVVDNRVVWKFLFFKRSYVRRHDGQFMGYPHLKKPDVFPLTYSIMESYIQSPMSHRREIGILCTLRGSKAMSTRLRVQNSVQRYIDAHPIELSTSVASELSGAGRRVVSNLYFKQMHNSSIIVTVNPAYWEGDFRLWEAMSSGALVFVDPLMVPHPFPLLDKKHVIHFSHDDEQDLFRKLDYYRSHPAEARAIALRGYYHAMKYHRSANTVDYILRTALTKTCTLNPHCKHKQEVERYRFTGQYLVAATKKQETSIKKSKLPGHYDDY